MYKNGECISDSPYKGSCGFESGPQADRYK